MGVTDLFFGKNDPLKIFVKFAKLIQMILAKESLKYRAEVLKYIGFAFMSPFSASVFMILTAYDEGVSRFKLAVFIISCVLFILGIKCVLRGIDILELYSIEENLNEF